MLFSGVAAHTGRAGRSRETLACFTITLYRYRCAAGTVLIVQFTGAALTVPGAADLVDLLTGAGLLILLGGLLYWAAAATRRHRNRE
jgi:hypothetical protein